MIKSIDYKLTKQPGTISEEIFKPNNNLIDFIKNILSLSLKIAKLGKS